MNNQIIKKNGKWIAIGAAVVILVIIMAVFGSNRVKDSEAVIEGRRFIESLEKADLSGTEQKIKEIKKQERIAALENGELDVWQQFDDSAIFGDSRAVGFYYFKYLPQERTFAAAGHTLRDIPTYIEQIKVINPSNIFICCGLNDISIGFWNNVDEYIVELDQRVQELREAVPGMTVYVNSIIPAIDPAFLKSEKWRAIPDWNVQIKAHCQEKGICYIDISDTVAAHQDLYDQDGIHMRYEFYPYWGMDMMMGVNEDED